MSAKIPWGAWVVVGIGLALVLVGAHGYYTLGHFGLRDALVCAVTILPAAIFLLVTSYVLQHARLVVVMPVVVGVMLAIGHPAFAVALGLSMIGAIAGPAFSEWRAARDDERRGLSK